MDIIIQIYLMLDQTNLILSLHHQKKDILVSSSGYKDKTGSSSYAHKSSSHKTISSTISDNYFSSL